MYGGVQQLRGAHFLSHDLWTAMICWCTALAVFRMAGPFQAALRQPEQKQGHADVANVPLQDNRHDVILSRTDKHAPF
ncbi:hypothetical protein [Xanthomonas hydrangeae]|uniref:hypothetical protein n=1 Tax=Xanthomonas hydrangeae TaxID=2775159 RepID=UPI001B3551C7